VQRGKIFRKGQSWHLRYKSFEIVNGKKVWRTTSTKLADYDLRHRTQQSVEADAETFLRGLNPKEGGAGSGPTFKEQSDIWLERCKTRQRNPIKPATADGWRSHLKVHILPNLQNTRLPDITNKVVRDFVTHLTGRLSAKSLRNVVQVIQMVKASAIDENGDEIYPTKWNRDFLDLPQIKQREQNRPSFTSPQIESLIAKADRRGQMFVILSAATGLRVSEVFGLGVQHFDGRSLTIEQAVRGGKIQTPKTEDSRRTVELHPGVAKLLKSFIGTRSTGFIFKDSKGTVVRQSNFLRRDFHPALKKSGLPRAGFHGFRRYRNTYLRNVAGCPDGLLKFWLGHSSNSDMSDRYDKVRDDPKFRLAQAKKMGIGFKLPRELKAEIKTPRKFVVRRVVRDFKEKPENAGNADKH
jgi:integrase